MDFSEALQALKNGSKVARTGWNGANQFVYHVPEGSYEPTTKIGKELSKETGLVPYGAYLAIKTVQGNVVPWLASQTDLLAEDWTTVELEPVV